MTEITTPLSVSLGPLLAAILLATLGDWYVRDITQKKLAILRNYPIVGHRREPESGERVTEEPRAACLLRHAPRTGKLGAALRACFA